MLYVCYLKQGKSVTRFLSVVELLGGTAEVIFESVKAIFALYKVPFDKCISIATDGASVMTGIRSGVTTRFSEQKSTHSTFKRQPPSTTRISKF
jgi:hypothetical protein